MAAGIHYTLGLKTSGFTGPLKGAMAGVGQLKQGMASLAGAALAVAAPLLGVASAAAAVAKSFSAAAERETLTTSLRVMIGSAEEAANVLQKLQQFAASTPFELGEDIGPAAKKLIAFGSSTETVIDELRALGDIASGAGISLSDLSDIYGKARVQGTLFAEDLNQLAGRGIPIFEELGKALGVSASEVKGLASEGKVGFSALVEAFSNMTAAGGRFQGMMAEQSKTTAGLLSTLKDAIHELFVAFGTPLNNALKPVLKDLANFVASMQPQIEAFGNAVGKAVAGIYAAIKAGKVGELLSLAFKAAGASLLNFLAAGFAALAPELAKVLGGALTAEFPRLSKLLGSSSGGDGKSFGQRFTEAQANPLIDADAAWNDLKKTMAELADTVAATASETDKAGESTRTLSEALDNSVKKIDMDEDEDEEKKPAAKMPALGPGVDAPEGRRRIRVNNSAQSALRAFERQKKHGDKDLETWLSRSPMWMAQLQHLAPGRLATTFNSGVEEVAEKLRTMPAADATRRRVSGVSGARRLGRSAEQRQADATAAAFQRLGATDKSAVLLQKIYEWIEGNLARA